jgi:hypothetical protein
LIDEKKRREDLEFLVAIKDKEIDNLQLQVDSLKQDLEGKDQEIDKLKS